MKKSLDDSVERNGYEGNGWSKYQIMVLQQLDDHNKILQNLNEEIVNLKQNVAVSETELKMWRAQTMSSLERLTDEVDEILYDESGLSNKVRALEKDNEVEEKLDLKSKAMWAVVGGASMFVINIIIKFIELAWKQ
jgi:hypothetical protein